MGAQHLLQEVYDEILVPLLEGHGDYDQRPRTDQVLRDPRTIELNQRVRRFLQSVNA